MCAPEIDTPGSVALRVLGGNESLVSVELFWLGADLCFEMSPPQTVPFQNIPSHTSMGCFFIGTDLPCSTLSGEVLRSCSSGQEANSVFLCSHMKSRDSSLNSYEK